MLRIKKLKFPGRAGELQRDGSTGALIRELGDNYATYHDFLVDEFERLGGRPDPKDFSELDDYFEACSRLRDILTAEALARQARANRKHGRPLGEVGDDPPLVDMHHRLLSVETDADYRTEGDSPPSSWRPPGRGLPPGADQD